MIAILTDTHAGVRTDSLHFDGEARQFFDNVFFPYIDEHNIKTIVHMGDLFDRRKFINFQILKNVKEYLFDQLVKRDMRMIIIPGNHDTYFKNTNEVNSLNLLLPEYHKHIQVISVAQDHMIDGVSVAMIPWICDENREQTMKFFSKTKSKICFGHLEIEGFEMYRGMGSHDGESPKIFEKFDLVLSGHYHHKNSIGHINYLGCPYEMTWSDFDDTKGFHTLDLKTQALEFIINPRKLHRKIFWDDRETLPKAKDYKGCAIKLVVVNKEDFVKFDAFVDALYKNEVFDVKILEDFGDIGADVEEDIDVEDTSTLLAEYVDGMEIDVDKDKLKTLLKGLYIEAINTVEV